MQQTEALTIAAKLTKNLEHRAMINKRLESSWNSIADYESLNIL